MAMMRPRICSGEVISQDGRRSGSVAALADPNEDARDKQRRERGRETRRSRREAPENHANPTMSQREKRSARKPRTGAESM